MDGSLCFFISIHALLTEGDRNLPGAVLQLPAISIHALLTEGDSDSKNCHVGYLISIHALLTEGDACTFQ